jgi:hypothetical protein
MSLIGRNPNWDSIILWTLFASCLYWSKTGKIAKIRYKSVITQFIFNKIKKKIRHTDHTCVAVSLPYWQPKTHASYLFNYSSNMSYLSITSKKRNIPVFYLCIRYIEVRMYLAICYPTCFCVANPLQSFSCLNSYSFLPLHAYKLTMYRNHQQKCKNLDFGPE